MKNKIGFVYKTKFNEIIFSKEKIFDDDFVLLSENLKEIESKKDVVDLKIEYISRKQKEIVSTASTFPSS